MDKSVLRKNGLRGEFTVPGDKSISHRAIMFSSLANGTSKINGFLMGDDCLSTIDCFRKMGIEIEINETEVVVHGKGLHGLKAPTEHLYVGNSGTTIRLLSGILSGQNFKSTILGDSSIQKRPMDRVVLPLSTMGANISGNTIDSNIYAPLTIAGTKLKPINYKLPVASAQVKSAILLASLYADDDTTIIEPKKTRDHTEIMLNYLGANIKREADKIISSPVGELMAKDISVPGDISSAAYFMVAAAITPNSKIRIKNLGINPTRTGIISILQLMGCNITLENEKMSCGELVSDVIVETSDLKGVLIEGDIIPTLIDEIPIIAVAAAFAEGTTIIKDAEELKVKESNRIKTVVTELKKFGVNIEETDDGMIIEGGNPIKGATCQSYNDHRIAMSMAIAGIMTDKTVIIDADCVDISFPHFFQLLEELS